MCTGMETLAIASIAASVAGGGMQMAGQAQQASQQAGMMNYQAQVARRNQEISERNARLVEEQGKTAEEQQRLRTSQVLGAQRAALASQGGDINSGSPLDIQGDTARAGEFDALTIRSDAALKAQGFRIQGQGFGSTADAYTTGAGNTMSSLPYGIGGTLLGTASSVGDKWMNYKNRGLFGGGSASAGDFLSYGGTAP